MKEKDTDIKQEIKEIRDLTEKNHKMIRSMRRLSLFRTLFFWSLIIFSGYQVYGFYGSIQSELKDAWNTVKSVKETTQGGIDIL